MKKNLVSLVSLVFLVGLVSLTSCKKEETLGNSTQFRATMEGCTIQHGKTALDGTALNWVEGDQIAVYGTAGNGIYAATPQTPATTAIFDNVSGETGDAPFRAYYPSTLTTDGVNITLPATQTYVEGSINEFPMYAESSNSELAFKNLCGVLKLHLTMANTSISSIEVVANSEVNGTFSVSYNSGAPVLTYVSGGSNSVTLNCTTAQDISEGADFYITLPATFDSVRSIILTTDDGLFCIKKVKNTSQINVSRSQYTLVTLDENDLEFSPYYYSQDLRRWINLSSTTDLLRDELSGSGFDALVSSLQSIGFSFPFGGNEYSHFSVNTDGNLKLGSTVTGTTYFNHPFSSTSATYNSPKINFLGADGYYLVDRHYVYAENTVDAHNNSLLVVEFCLGSYSLTGRNQLYKWQVHLYPNGDIEIVYPSNMPEIAFPSQHQQGFCKADGSGWIVDQNSNATYFANGTSISWPANTWPGANTVYYFSRNCFVHSL